MAENEASSAGTQPVLIAVVVAILMLGGAWALCYYVLPEQIAIAIAKGQRQADSEAGNGVATASAGSKSGKPGEAGKGGGNVQEFTINDLLVNVGDAGGLRFVKASVFFDADASVLTDLEHNRAKITDIVSQTISSKKLAELTASDIRGKLRQELIAIINPLLDAKGEVRNVYFPELIIQ